MSKENILVCGTGIVGLAAALSLARTGFQVTLLGPRNAVPVYDTNTYCPRVYAVSAASQAFLQQLGVWNMLNHDRVVPVQAMDIQGDASGRVQLNAWQAATTNLAWILESSELERVLQQAVSLMGVNWIAENFRSLQAGTVRTESGRSLPFDLLVGADGAGSAVRKAAGIGHTSRPYGYTGVVAHLNAELPHQNVAWQWFTGESVLALLPMPDTDTGPQVSMVWSMPAAQATDLLAMPQDQRSSWLASHLNAATGGQLGALSLRSSVHGFPLFLESSGMAVQGVALVGDAAHRVHPLAGQGLNLGLGDVQALLQCLENKEPFRPAGDERIMARYRRARAEPVRAMSLATDGLHKLFAIQAPPVVWARNLGMHCVDRVPFIKRFLINAAAGHGVAPGNENR
jgi:ubiquinone biosynthesis UbiH/UbiF/VisC/COQ6 family hydroxylase